MNTVTVRLEDGELVGSSETMGIVTPPEWEGMNVPNPVRLQRR